MGKVLGKSASALMCCGERGQLGAAAAAPEGSRDARGALRVSVCSGRAWRGLNSLSHRATSSTAVSWGSWSQRDFSRA